MFLSLFLALFFTNSFIADEFTRGIEEQVYPLHKMDTYDVGIVLGGGMITLDSENNRYTFRHNTDRILQALLLYKKGIIKHILISSGSGSLLYPEMLEAQLLYDYLLSIGFPAQDIWIESASNNTHENALFSKPILEKNAPKGKYLLITSAIHMKRAKRCFDKINIPTTPFPTNKLVGQRRFDLAHLLLPNSEALLQWNKIIHESIGIITYKMMGYI